MTIKITCLVVTYNRLTLLKKALANILAQTKPIDELVIIDNASTDGTSEFLGDLSANDKKIVYVRLPKNTGGAGGYYYGIKEAYTRGADWIWTMDDDSIPLPNALEKLINSDVTDNSSSTIGFLCSRVDWVDGSVCRMNIPRGAEDWITYHPTSPVYSKVKMCSFVSALFAREAIRAVGFPVKDFFIWFDDAEFTRRISEHYNCFYVADSVVIHETKENYDPGDFEYLNDESLWKFKYGIRNEVAYISSLRAGIIRGLLYLGARTLLLIKAERSSWHIFQMILAGFSGFFFRYKKHIEIPLE